MSFWVKVPLRYEAKSQSQRVMGIMICRKRSQTGMLHMQEDFKLTAKGVKETAETRESNVEKNYKIREVSATVAGICACAATHWNGFCNDETANAYSNARAAE